MGPVNGYYAITNTTPVTSFSPYIVGNYNSVDGPLPVQLAEFTSNVTGRDVKLNWTTANETNNSGFEIQRTAISGSKSDEWLKEGFVKGSGTKNTRTDYSFTDKKLNTGKFKYRIKQIDYNGNFEYFNLNNIVEISSPAKIELSQNYPNPFNPATNINFQLPESEYVTLKVYDITGREISTLFSDKLNAGYYEKQFDGSGLPSGIYFYQLVVNNIKYAVKKMLLIK